MSGFPFHLPPKHRCDIQEFPGWANVADVDWRTWRKPDGVSMLYIVAIGGGGGGGSGVIGAASTAGGGGGGGAGGLSTLLIPAFLLPDVLYVTAPAGKTGAGLTTRVAIDPNATTNHQVLVATGGSVGGNASGASGGGSGNGASNSTLASSPIAGRGVAAFLSGQNGSAGGSGGAAGANVPYTTAGQISSAGTGGGSLTAAGVAGSAGGGYSSVPAAPSRFPPLAGGAGGAAATTPPGDGSCGMKSFITNFLQCYGGTGGGSTHGSATGAGLVQARGGDGFGYGCGGGGMGGALTGSTPAVASLGGPGYVCIIAW